MGLPDFLVALTLAASGFSGMATGGFGGADAVVELDEDGPLRGRPWAVYVNAFPGTGRSVEHVHVNCVPAHHVPLPPWLPASWQICRSPALSVGGFGEG